RKKQFIYFSVLILFVLFFIANRILHPRTTILNLKYNTSLIEVLWKYGKPEVANGVYNFPFDNTDEHIIMYRISENSSCQLLFYHNKLISLNFIDNGIIHQKDIKK
ncbi:hypothetical protein, partial [Treponema sp.]|uniref:hypothetical protein n=1 Tax=Treponema sp. TaxID=166 RepID=UPI00298E8D39